MDGFWSYLRDVDWQQLVSLAIIAAAAALLLGSRFRRRSSFHRQTGCGCVGAAVPSRHGSIVFRARKGHRAEVRVKTG
jgi:hypothetical protein